MRQRRVVTALAIPLVLAFVAASCGSDDSSSEGTTGGDATEETTVEDDGGGESETDTTVAPAEDEVDTTVVEETEVPVFGGSLAMGLEAEATGLRPWDDFCSEPCANIARTMMETIAVQNSDGEYEGLLAESIEPNEDFTQWTVTLRPGITFSNGVPLTAQSLVDMFAIQQAGSQSSGTIATTGLTTVEAVDELTAVYTLASPFSAFPAFLAGVTLGYVFEPGAAAADPVGFSTAPVGTGPFVMQNRDLNNETVVVRNDNYWQSDENGDQLPYLDMVTFRPIPDEGTRLDALLSGTVDMIESRRGGTIRDARDQDGIELYEFTGNQGGGGMFNTLVAPLDDQRVRLGLNYLNDQERVIEALGQAGITPVATQWFSPDDPYWTQAAADTYPPFDFEMGKDLLQQYVDDPNRSDGKAPGEKIDVELSCPPDPTLIAAMQVLEQVWAGSELVNVTLTQFDQATHIGNALADTHQAHCWRWGTQADPSSAVNPFVTDPAVSPSNLTNFLDPEMVAWAQEAIQTEDFEERKELYSKIMTRINEEGLLWYSGGTPTMIATEEGIRGVNNYTLPSGSLGAGTPGALTYFTQQFIAGS